MRNIKQLIFMGVIFGVGSASAAESSQGSWKLVNDGGIKAIRDDSVYMDEKTGKEKAIGGMDEFESKASAGLELKEEKKDGNLGEEEESDGKRQDGPGHTGTAPTAPPIWSKLTTFTHTDVSYAISWMSHELTACEGTSDATRRGCVSDVLEYHGGLRNRIGRGINTNANDLELRAPWVESGSQLQTLQSRANELRR